MGGITLLIVAGLTIYAWTAKTDFTGLGPYLMAGLLAFILFGFTLSIMSWFGLHMKPIAMAYHFCGVLLFSFFIIYDTQLILGEWGGHSEQFSVDDYCFAALNLYLDIINLFLQILRLLGEERD